MRLVRSARTYDSMRKQAGDTIVEVLIAIAIVSLVLVSGYALTARNNAASQEVQEQSNALKLVERQSEQLLAAKVAPTPLPGCFGASGNFVLASSSECSVNSNGESYTGTDAGAQYILSISQNASTYTINAQWVTINGQTANVSTYLRRAD